MRLLTEDWGYPVVESELDPNDPLVNTASEYMYQMAVIGYHVLHGNHEVVLTEDQEYKGKVYNFCCSMCLKDFNKDPEKYVAKVEEMMVIEAETEAKQEHDKHLHDH